jgi:hypothetical protein
VKDALIAPVPLLKVHEDGAETGVPVRQAYTPPSGTPISKPVPDTAMMTPACPEVALSVIVGAA